MSDPSGAAEAAHPAPLAGDTEPRPAPRPVAPVEVALPLADRLGPGATPLTDRADPQSAAQTRDAEQHRPGT